MLALAPDLVQELTKLFVVLAVEEVSEQSRHLLRQALERAQADLARRLELISQIRAMESVPVIRHKFLDDTEVIRSA